MQVFTYTIKDPLGLHARPASILVNEAKKYDSELIAAAGNRTASLKNIIQVMALGAVTGLKLTVMIEGEDEVDAAAQIEHIFQTVC